MRFGTATAGSRSPAEHVERSGSGEGGGPRNFKGSDINLSSSLVGPRGQRLGAFGKLELGGAAPRPPRQRGMQSPTIVAWDVEDSNVPFPQVERVANVNELLLSMQLKLA